VAREAVGGLGVAVEGELPEHRSGYERGSAREQPSAREFSHA